MLAVLSLSALGWAYLALSAASDTLLSALCRPALGGGAALLLTLPMWGAMVLAMMLPTAGPMILTYAEIADAAARKGERIVSPLVLVAGYLAVWLGFALFATVLQAVLARMALLDPATQALAPPLAGALFVAAGIYQFSALKHSCLARCQRPFPFFFANWTDRAPGVFRLGLRQGRDCLGCCWALMLLMFAIGVMNVAWMAALGVMMALEKMATTPRPSRAIGTVVIAIGVALLTRSLA